MNEAAEDDRYNVQNAEQPMRVLEGNFLVQNDVVGVRRLEAGGLVHVRGRLRKLVDQGFRLCAAHRVRDECEGET